MASEDGYNLGNIAMDLFSLCNVNKTKICTSEALFEGKIICSDMNGARCREDTFKTSLKQNGQVRLG